MLFRSTRRCQLSALLCWHLHATHTNPTSNPNPNPINHRTLFRGSHHRLVHNCSVRQPYISGELYSLLTVCQDSTLKPNTTTESPVGSGTPTRSHLAEWNTQNHKSPPRPKITATIFFGMLLLETRRDDARWNCTNFDGLKSLGFRDVSNCSDARAVKPLGLGGQFVDPRFLILRLPGREDRFLICVRPTPRCPVGAVNYTWSTEHMFHGLDVYYYIYEFRRNSRSHSWRFFILQCKYPVPYVRIIHLRTAPILLGINYLKLVWE